MSANNTSKKNIPPAAKNPPAKGNAQKKNAQKKVRFSQWYWLAGILALTFIVFIPAIKNAFTDWDDPNYILDNPLIRDLSASNIKRIFSEIYFGNYQPLHILSYAIEYQLYKFNPAGYHTSSIMLHVIATGLVLWFIFSLTENPTVAIVTALLFGIHPIHVESVAWAAERKDLLYAVFFLASLIFYIRYIRSNEKSKYLFLAFLFFSLSILSKAMASSLPPVLILLDIYFKRKLNAKLLIEKIPFFLLAVGLGILSIHAAGTTNTISMQNQYSLSERVLFANFNVLAYIGKLILPLELSAFYPYPDKIAGSYPFYYYASPLVVLVLAFLVIRSMKKTNTLFFAGGFFIITVFLVLQLLPVGRAIMAERYMYIPSIAVFYLVGEAFSRFWNRTGQPGSFRVPAAVLLGIMVVFYSAQTYSRCGVWKDGMTLWNDVISKHNNVAEAYNNRGILFANEKKYNEALNDYNKALELEPDFHITHNNRGIILANQFKRYDEALADYNKAIEVKPNYAIAYNNRGVLFKTQKRFEEAYNDFSKAIEFKPDYVDAYSNRGSLLKNQNRFDEALKDLNRVLEIRPNYPKGYSDRGHLMAVQKRNQEALSDYNTAIRLNPDFINAYNNRGSLYMTEKKFDQAIMDFSKVTQLQPDYGEAYYNRGLCEYDSGKKTEGCLDMKKAAGLGVQAATIEYTKLCQ